MLLFCRRAATCGPPHFSAGSRRGTGPRPTILFWIGAKTGGASPSPTTNPHRSLRRGRRPRRPAQIYLKRAPIFGELHRTLAETQHPTSGRFATRPTALFWCAAQQCTPTTKKKKQSKMRYFCGQAAIFYIGPDRCFSARCLNTGFFTGVTIHCSCDNLSLKRPSRRRKARFDLAFWACFMYYGNELII